MNFSLVGNSLMATTSAKDDTDKPTKIPESVRKALDTAYSASKELIKTSKSLLDSHTPSRPIGNGGPSSSPSALSSPIDAIAKLSGLLHSHTVRTALTCGPTASSPTATLDCIKALHEPILPLVTEFQRLSTLHEFPGYFVMGIRKEIMSLFDAIVAFLGEVVEIARGDGDVGSRERLQYSGMVMEVCDRLQRICGDGPIGMVCRRLKDTHDMLDDALEEVVGIIEDEIVDDGWSEDPAEYTAEEKKYAERVHAKLRLLSLLYKAISRRRLTPTTPYTKSSRSTLDIVHAGLTTLSVAVDELVSGITGQEDPMTLELSFIQIMNESRKLATALRLPLNGEPDGRESWFDTWLAKLA